MEPNSTQNMTSIGGADLQQNRQHGLQPETQFNWTPGLESIPDEYDYAPPQISNVLMRQNNRSVPSLPSERPPPQYTEHIEPNPRHPSFDPTSTLDQFSALRLNDHNLPQLCDPIPRAASSMSVNSTQSPQRLIQQPRHANTLPLIGPSPFTITLADGQYNADAVSVYSRESRNSRQDSGNNDAYGNGSLESDHTSPLSYDEHVDSYVSPDGNLFQYQAHTFPQHTWQAPQSDIGMGRPVLPISGDYDPFHAAASNVLGMGPPPRSPPQTLHSAGSINASSHPTFASSQGSFPPSQMAPYPRSSDSSLSLRSNVQTSMPRSLDIREVEFQPSFRRSGTGGSANLGSVKSRAVDLSAPPFTKEYIDQYRQRIKGDPDPEAQFLYAKYLIDAAKKIGADARDQRAVKKYRDALVGESLKVVRRLATQGQAYDEAQFFLANCYGTGSLGLQVDHERAYHLYLQAAKQNHAAAAYRVAVCNEIGAGTKREPPRAAAFYRKAASLGDTAAMYKLGMILLHGSLGEQKNPREAINWLKRAAEQADEENPHALHELGLLHEQPDSPLVLYDPIYAKNLFTQAAQLGYTQSQYKLGQCYEYGSLGCPVDPRRSIAWYTKAAEKGDSEAELALSGWYLTGSEGVLKQSDSEAYLWARRAANKGLSKAEYAVGYYAEVGIGITQDVEFAKRWYMRAAAQGNKRAMNRLTEMKRMGNKRANVARPTRQQAKDECIIC